MAVVLTCPSKGMGPPGQIFYSVAMTKKQKTEKTEKGLEVPVPTKGDFDAAMKKVAPPAGRKRPDGKDRPPQQSE